jgi:hypothetical protein
LKKLRNINSKLLRNIINSAQFKAENISKYHSLSWVVSDSENVICCEGGRANESNQKILDSIRSIGENTHVFYLSIEPNNVLFDIKELLDCVEESSIEHWIIEKGVHWDLKNLQFSQWEKTWPGEVTYIKTDFNDKRQKIISNYIKSQYPWNISICCSNISGEQYTLHSARKKMGLLPNVVDIIKNCDFILCSRDQAKSLECLPKYNNKNALIEILYIDSPDQVEPILRYIKSSMSLLTMTICDNSLIRYLVSNNLTQEINYNILLKNTENKKLSTNITGYYEINFGKEWRVSSNHLSDNCCRIELVNTRYEFKDLKSGFN